MSNRTTGDLPWYQDGLRFRCRRCGGCCTGAPGFVWVNRREVVALAGELGLTVERFEELYIRKIGIRFSLREFPGGDCVFFDPETRGCRVYRVRPRQCRTWPFWESNTRTPEAWDAVCENCPGSGRGALHRCEVIEARRDTLRV